MLPFKTILFSTDFSPTSHLLLRLRLLHPITAILTSVFLIFLTGWLAKERLQAGIENHKDYLGTELAEPLRSV